MLWTVDKTNKCNEKQNKREVAPYFMIEYTIYCDVCGEMIDLQTGSARQARKKAKAKGLLVRILRKDYCRKCCEKLHNEGEIDGYINESKSI